MVGRPRTGRTRRDRVIKILVTEDLDEAVTAAADAAGDTVSTWGQRLFEREVQRAIGRSRAGKP